MATAINNVYGVLELNLGYCDPVMEILIVALFMIFSIIYGTTNFF